MHFGSWTVLSADNSLTAPFVESFDKLSGNSQRAMQQLVTQSSNLIPEGSSIRDSFDKLSGNTQQALYHLINSGLPLPSFLPQKLIHETDNTAVTDADDIRAAKAKVAQLTADLSKAEKENALITDLLQHSQHELAVSQARIHELLTSVAKIEDERSLLASQNGYLQATLEKVPEAKECIQQQYSGQVDAQAQQCAPCRTRDDANELYGTFGSQVSPQAYSLLPCLPQGSILHLQDLLPHIRAPLLHMQAQEQTLFHSHIARLLTR